MKTFLGIAGGAMQNLGILMILGMLTVPWLDFMEYTVAPLLQTDQQLTWATGSLITILGLITAGIFLESWAEGVSFKEMF